VRGICDTASCQMLPVSRLGVRYLVGRYKCLLSVVLPMVSDVTSVQIRTDEIWLVDMSACCLSYCS